MAADGQRRVKGGGIVSKVPGFDRVDTCEKLKGRAYNARINTGSNNPSAIEAAFFDLCGKDRRSGAFGVCLCVPMEAAAARAGAAADQTITVLRLWIEDFGLADNVIATANKALDTISGNSAQGVNGRNVRSGSLDSLSGHNNNNGFGKLGGNNNNGNLLRGSSETSA